MNTIQDNGRNFRDDDGKLYLTRCYACEPDHGRENYLPAVASGVCAWCGWHEMRKEQGHWVADSTAALVGWDTVMEEDFKPGVCRLSIRRDVGEEHEFRQVYVSTFVDSKGRDRFGQPHYGH